MPERPIGNPDGDRQPNERSAADIARTRRKRSNRVAEKFGFRKLLAAANWPYRAMSRDHPDLEDWQREALDWAEAAEQRVQEAEREALSQARMKAECYEEWKIAEQVVSVLKEALARIATAHAPAKHLQNVARAALSDEAKPE